MFYFLENTISVLWRKLIFRVRFWLYRLNASIAGKIITMRSGSGSVLCLNTGLVAPLSFVKYLQQPF